MGTLSGASSEYRRERQRLLEAEVALRNHRIEVAGQRRALPLGPRIETDYSFEEGPRDLDDDSGESRRVELADLFLAGKDSLVVYHLMYAPEDEEACPMCSMWVDGFNGVASHLTERMAFAVIAKAPLAKLRLWARRRGWRNLRLLSSYGTSFNPDMGVEGPGGEQYPGISVFTQRRDGVHHVYTGQAFLADGVWGGLDMYSPVWHVLDLLPEGRGDWYPSNAYAEESRIRSGRAHVTR